MSFSLKWWLISYWQSMQQYSTGLNFEQKYRFIQYVSKFGDKNA